MIATHGKHKFPRAPLFAALALACDEIDTQLSDNLADISTGELSTKCQELKAENELLRRKIHELTRPNFGKVHDCLEPTDKPRKGSSATTEAFSSEDACADSALKAAHARLQRQLNALSDNLKSATALLRKRKEERNEWRRRAQELKNEVGNLRAQLCLPGAGDMHAGAEATDLRTRRHKRSTAGDAYSCTDSQYLCNLLESQGKRQLTEEPFLPAVADHSVDASLPIKLEPSSDAPIVVSERPVKKRPHIDQSHKIHQSSASESHKKLRVSCTQESLDLGDIEQSMTTPRKPKDLGNVYFEGKVQASQPANISPSSNTVPRKQPRFSTCTPHRKDVLKQMSPNITSTRSATSLGRECRKGRRLGPGVSKLGKDEESYAADSSFLGEGSSELLMACSKRNQAKTILEIGSRKTGIVHHDRSPSHEHQTSVSAPKSFVSALKKENARRGSVYIKKEKQAVFGGDNGLAQSSASAAGSECEANGSDGRSLRQRRLTTLGTGHFRINPTANGGHSFAFSDVVRDKTERAHMQGCTKMHCCGKVFRELALSQRPNPPLTPAQRIEEQLLLEQYLGDRTFRLTSMDKEEREQLWVEAKTQELANKYGKHRTHYSRMQSPPGFWNADFPSSQQLHAERAEAAAREKYSVSERYREAMRPNGRWVFKDE